MKFIFLTSMRFPSARPVYIYMKSMALAFGRVLGDQFTFVTAGPIRDDFKGTKVKSINVPERFRVVLYFLYLPFWIIKNGYSSETVIFSPDPYLSSILIFWRKIFFFKYKIFSDWHMLFDDWRDKFVAKGSDFLVSTNHKIENAIIKKTGIDPKNATVSYGGVDVEMFRHVNEDKASLRKRLGLPEGFLVGYVGFYKTMNLPKGVDTMIRSLTYIGDKSVKMAFVGAIDDKEAAEYRAIAMEAKVAERAFFLPAVKAHEVPVYEQAMDMLVIPYPDQPHFRNYGFPMKVYEYMFSGKPIIYSNLDIIDEMLFDCGLSFKPDDSKDLAEKIENLSQNPEMMKKLGEEATKKVMGCTWEKRAERIAKFAGFQLKT